MKNLNVRALSLLLVASGGVGVCLADAHLFYEGSEHFVLMVEHGLDTDHFRYPGRVGWYLFMAPLLVARLVTDHLPTLSATLGVPFIMLPLVSLMFVHKALRQRPSAALVATIGICLPAWPWQAFWGAPWSVVIHLSWMFLACTIAWNDGRGYRVFGYLLAGFLFFVHPLSAVPLVSVGLAGRLIGQSWRVSGVWILLGFLRGVLVLVEPHEVRRFREFSREEVYFGFGHEGAALVVLALVLIVVAATVVSRSDRRRWAYSVAAQLAAAASLVAYLTINPRPWLLGIDFRLWTFAVLPILLVAALRVARRSEPVPAWATLAPVAVFVGMATASAFSFKSEVDRLHAATQAPCVDFHALPAEFRAYPLHDAVFSHYVIATAGTYEPQAVLSWRPCADVCWQPDPASPPVFDLSVLPDRSASGKACGARVTDILQ